MVRGRVRETEAAMNSSACWTLTGCWTPRCDNSPWARECAATWPRRSAILPPPLPGRTHHWPGNRQCVHQRRDRNGPVPPGNLPRVVPPLLHLRRPPGRDHLLPRPGDPGPARSPRLLRMDAVPVPAGGSGIPVHCPPRLESRRASLSVHGELMHRVPANRRMSFQGVPAGVAGGLS